MAFVINDRVKETTTTTGTNPFALAGAVTGFETFGTGIGNSNTTYYAVTLPGSTEFEVGLGTLSSDYSTIARTTIISSSNSDNAVFILIIPWSNFEYLSCNLLAFSSD